MNRFALIVICTLLLSAPLFNAACELPSQPEEIAVVEEEVYENYDLTGAVVVQTSGAWEAGDLDDFVNTYVKEIFEKVVIQGADYEISSYQTIPIIVVGAGGEGSGIATVTIDGKFDPAYKGFRGTYNVDATVSALEQDPSEPIDLIYKGELLSEQVSDGKLGSLLNLSNITLTFSGDISSQAISNILGKLIGAAQETFDYKPVGGDTKPASIPIYPNYKTEVKFEIIRQ